MAADKPTTTQRQRQTRVLRVDPSHIGNFDFTDSRVPFEGDWGIQPTSNNPDAANLREAARSLRNSDIPVAFPTETVYGLGADATRSSAVRGIYIAKQRPSDNPLIVHISSLIQLRELLYPEQFGSTHEHSLDFIPRIYHELISRFWPGPLTILLPLPAPSPFALEVTAALPTVGVRMPSSPLALALIHLAGVPLAAPSANASSKPSPTTAAHVLHDLDGRIDLILDGGPCTVGIESTVIDGLSTPPTILRPGGVSKEMLKKFPGWEEVQVAYNDRVEVGIPRAPGMKYKHYSPVARMLLFYGMLDRATARSCIIHEASIGVLRTKTWPENMLQRGDECPNSVSMYSETISDREMRLQTMPYQDSKLESPEIADSLRPIPVPSAQHSQAYLSEEPHQSLIDVWDIGLGSNIAEIARGLFSALRELDQKGVDVIFVEGIDDAEGNTAEAVMNRLRKAAEAEIML